MSANPRVAGHPVDPVESEPYDAGNPEHVKAAKKQNEIYRDTINAGFGTLATSKNGRAWLWDHIVACGLFLDSFTGNSQTFFNEGARKGALKIWTDLYDKHLDELILMLRESKERRRVNTAGPTKER